MNNEQQPVAWWNPTKDTVSTDPIHRNNPDYVPLYTEPVQREWVGLTSKERFQIQREMEKYYDFVNQCKTVCLPEFAHAIETKLMEKNRIERIVFPTMLRRMWSGSEVQQWLDEHVNGGKHEPKPNQDICGND